MQTKRQGVELGFIEDHQGPEKIAPGADKHKHRQGDQVGPGRWNHHVPPLPHRRAAIATGRLLQLHRHPQEALPQQENAKGGGRLGNDQGPEGVAQADLHHQQVERNHHHLEGDQNRCYHQGQHQAAAAKIHAGQGVGRQRAEEHIGQHRQATDNRAVEQVGSDWIVAKKAPVGLKAGLTGPEGWRAGENVLRRTLERGAHQPQQRHQHRQGHQQQQNQLGGGTEP